MSRGDRAGGNVNVVWVASKSVPPSELAGMFSQWAAIDRQGIIRSSSDREPMDTEAAATTNRDGCLQSMTRVDLDEGVGWHLPRRDALRAVAWSLTFTSESRTMTWVMVPPSCLSSTGAALCYVNVADALVVATATDDVRDLPVALMSRFAASRRPHLVLRCHDKGSSPPRDHGAGESSACFSDAAFLSAMSLQWVKDFVKPSPTWVIRQSDAEIASPTIEEVAARIFAATTAVGGDAPCPPPLPAVPAASPPCFALFSLLAISPAPPVAAQLVTQPSTSATGGTPEMMHLNGEDVTLMARVTTPGARPPPPPLTAAADHRAALGSWALRVRFLPGDDDELPNALTWTAVSGGSIDGSRTLEAMVVGDLVRIRLDVAQVERVIHAEVDQADGTTTTSDGSHCAASSAAGYAADQPLIRIWDFAIGWWEWRCASHSQSTAAAPLASSSGSASWDVVTFDPAQCDAWQLYNVLEHQIAAVGHADERRHSLHELAMDSDDDDDVEALPFGCLAALTKVAGDQCIPGRSRFYVRRLRCDVETVWAKALSVGTYFSLAVDARSPGIAAVYDGMCVVHSCRVISTSRAVLELSPTWELGNNKQRRHFRRLWACWGLCPPGTRILLREDGARLVAAGTIRNVVRCPAYLGPILRQTPYEPSEGSEVNADTRLKCAVAFFAAFSTAAIAVFVWMLITALSTYHGQVAKADVLASHTNATRPTTVDCHALNGTCTSFLAALFQGCGRQAVEIIGVRGCKVTDVCCATLDVKSSANDVVDCAALGITSVPSLLSSFPTAPSDQLAQWACCPRFYGDVLPVPLAHTILMSITSAITAPLFALLGMLVAKAVSSKKSLSTFLNRASNSAMLVSFYFPLAIQSAGRRGLAAIVAFCSKCRVAARDCIAGGGAEAALPPLPDETVQGLVNSDSVGVHASEGTVGPSGQAADVGCRPPGYGAHVDEDFVHDDVADHQHAHRLKFLGARSSPSLFDDLNVVSAPFLIKSYVDTLVALAYSAKIAATADAAHLTPWLRYQIFAASMINGGGLKPLVDVAVLVAVNSLSIAWMGSFVMCLVLVLAAALGSSPLGMLVVPLLWVEGPYLRYEYLPALTRSAGFIGFALVLLLPLMATHVLPGMALWFAPCLLVTLPLILVEATWLRVTRTDRATAAMRDRPWARFLTKLVLVILFNFQTVVMFQLPSNAMLVAYGGSPSYPRGFIRPLFSAPFNSTAAQWNTPDDPPAPNAPWLYGSPYLEAFIYPIQMAKEYCFGLQSVMSIARPLHWILQAI